MYIRYIVFTKYIRLIYLLETIDKKDLPPLQLTKADKCIFCFGSIGKNEQKISTNSKDFLKHSQTKTKINLIHFTNV